MRSVNKVILIGNVTRDPELRQTPNGQSVVTFGLATNREWVTRGGQKNNLAEFHDVVAWANLAEICHQYLKKGKLVYIEGYLKTRSWDTPEGVKKFKTEIVVQDMIMLDKRTTTVEAEQAGENQSENQGEQDDYIPEEESTGNGEENRPAHAAPATRATASVPPKSPAIIKDPELAKVNAAPVGIDDDLGL
jgi:single-strand DNA-binding protein